MSADGVAVARTYRRSALTSALVRMWRAWTVIVPVVVVNALVQALLVWPAHEVEGGWVLTVAAVVSALVFAAAFACVAAAALRAPDARVSWGAITSILRRRWMAYGLWSLALLIAVAIGLAINPVVALVVLALTPFLLLAAIDGGANPLMTNFRTIGHRFWRWLVTSLIIGGAVVLGTVLMGVTQFFLRNSFGALVVWLVAGLVISWFTVAWSLIYRNAWAEHEEPPAPVAPDLEPSA